MLFPGGQFEDSANTFPRRIGVRVRIDREKFDHKFLPAIGIFGRRRNRKEANTIGKGATSINANC